MKIIQISEIKIAQKRKDHLGTESAYVTKAWRRREWAEKKRRMNSGNDHRQKYDTFSSSDASTRAENFPFFLRVVICLILSASFSSPSSSSFANGLHWWFVCMYAMFKHEKEEEEEKNGKNTKEEEEEKRLRMSSFRFDRRRLSMIFKLSYLALVLHCKRICPNCSSLFLKQKKERLRLLRGEKSEDNERVRTRKPWAWEVVLSFAFIFV